MQEDRPFHQLWLQFSEQELLSNTDWLFQHAPSYVTRSLCTIHLHEGHKLIEQGAPSDFVYIVMEGEFVINKLAENGRQLGLAFCYRGEFLGEAEALCQLPYRYDVLSLCQSRVLCCDSQAFLAWLSQDHSMSVLLNRQLAKRLIISGEQRLMSAVDSIENNLLFMLRNISSRQIHLPRNVLAGLLCTSRRHLDKVILRLKEQGLIEQQGSTLRLSGN